MRRGLYRGAFLTLPLMVALFTATATWAGCSDETGGDSPSNADAAPEAVAPLPDVFVPVEAAVDAALAARDCKADQQADGVQMHLDCTGLYSNFASKTVATENQPYAPAVSFWSDGAEKARFIFLPAGAKIDITSFDEWVFPNGTKIWKEFKIAGKRIETRLYFKSVDAWHHTTYRWNDAETDAVRKDNGEKVAYAGKPPYEVPNTGECDACHAGRKEPVLGFEAVQLGLPGATGLTLAALASQNRFNLTPPMTSITIPDDGSTKAAGALGWLHANCGQCHNSSDNAGAQFTGLFFLLRPSQLLSDAGVVTTQMLDPYKTAVNVAALRQNDDAGVPYYRIAGGDLSMSLASILSGRRVAATEDPNTMYQMPPLVTRQVDTAGHKLLDDWIVSLPPP